MVGVWAGSGQDVATVFMKWLETSPKDYDRGIQLLTLGRIGRVKRRILREYVQGGMRVLEIGCGTGGLAESMARAGASVVGIDSSPGMLDVARSRIEAAGLTDRATVLQTDATSIGNHFPEQSFDLIVSTLVFSELTTAERRFVLEACGALLKPDGLIVIADEVVPEGGFTRLAYHLVRLPLVVLTWLLTRTTTSGLRGFQARLADAGLTASISGSYLGGSLLIYEIRRAGAKEAQAELPPSVIGRLRHRVSLRTRLLDVWTLFFRIIPPYPKVTPGLYALGRPNRGSPVLVTGNFDLTVRRLVRAIDGRVDAWILVVNSAGINVWCASGGGYMTAEKVIAGMNASRLHEVVDHHALVLPQLCGNGVDGWKIRKETGWGVHWGPVRAEDIPEYLASKRKKTDRMRWVRFPLRDRLEMVTVTLGFYGLLILLPVFLIWRDLFPPIAVALLGLSYFYAVALPWIPGRDGLFKSIPLTALALAGMALYALFVGGMGTLDVFHWGVGLTGMSVFTAAEMQGMSPLMRGEQANWGWEAIIGTGLVLAYWLVPIVLGWR
jgi:ubiquinone/menaquinone biosynthesis C-methylase UbiE